MIYTFTFVTALFVWVYHYLRNGNNPFNVQYGDVAARLMWSGAFALGYLVLSGNTYHGYTTLWFIVAAYVQLLIPHAFCMNMGRWEVPWSAQPFIRYWPGAWLPQYSQTDWHNLEPSKRTRLDFLGMLSVGLLRGVIVFAPTLFLGHTGVSVLFATVLTTLLMPFSYLLGLFIPWQLLDNPPRSVAWGEFSVGIVWAVALAALVCL